MTAMVAAPRKTAVRASLLLILAVAVALVTLPRFMGEAQTPGLQLVASNWDGGGGRLTQGNMILESSIGQPDAGTLTNGSLVLEGGFQHSQLVLDINCDDRVNATDPLFGLGVLTGFNTASTCSVDANRDGTFGIADVLLIQRRLAGLP